MKKCNKLKEDIGINRYKHSIRVRDTAVELAKKYNCDVKKASLAGLLHDCGKYYDKDYLLKLAFEFDIMADESLIGNKHIIHAHLGAVIAEKEYKVDDADILNAIHYHTTGRENMTKLEKIVYLADYIEPRREFRGIDQVRQLAYEDIDMAMLKALEDTIYHLLSTVRPIHIDTIKARNYLIQDGGK